MINEILKEYNQYTEFLRSISLFYKHFLFSKSHQDVLEYLMTNRGLSEEIIKEFQIGYCPTPLQLHLDFIEKNHLNENLLYDLGVAEKEDKFLWMQDRITFPITDFYNGVIGFSGRVFREGDERAKYLNSPTTSTFCKSLTVFGLSQSIASIIEKDCVIVVEGNLDVVTCHQYNIKNAVSPCGTSFTLPQLLLISSFTKNIICCFDNDLAGNKASKRAEEKFKQVSLPFYNMTLSDGTRNKQDPDSFIRQYGSEPITDYINSLMERRVY
jgi:DNA primase